MCPIFDYKGVGPTGKTIRGIIEADTSKGARTKLKRQGVLITDISEKMSGKGNVSQGGSLPFLGGKVAASDIALMTRQLASLVKANIPLVDALGALTEQTESDKLRLTLSTVRQAVNEGTSLAKAMKDHPKVFDTIFINMVEAGEASGTLGLVLLRLADLKEAQMRLRAKVVSGMAYPALMVVVAFGLLVALFTFVIPKITQIFESTGKALPTSTKALIFISEVVINQWYFLVLAAMTSAWLFRRYIQTTAGRRKWDGFKLKVPVFGSLLRMIAITRFATTMSTLLGSGVPILTAMTIARNLVGNVLIAEAVSHAKENVTEGQSIADPLKRSGQFPPLVIHMIAIGERTGELPEMLNNVASTYEEQVNAKIEGLTALLEPLMIIVMGGMVGFIVMSIFVPLMDINSIK